MARVDKTDSAIGVVRALLAADIPDDLWDTTVGVGLDAQGRCVVGAGQTGIIGVIVPGRTAYRATTVADIFLRADIVENTDLAAGSLVYAAEDGTVSNTAGGTLLGFTVEADRIILNVGAPAAGA